MIEIKNIKLLIEGKLKIKRCCYNDTRTFIYVDTITDEAMEIILSKIPTKDLRYYLNNREFHEKINNGEIKPKMRL